MCDEEVVRGGDCSRERWRRGGRGRLKSSKRRGAAIFLITFLLMMFYDIFFVDDELRPRREALLIDDDQWWFHIPLKPSEAGRSATATVGFFPSAFAKPGAISGCLSVKCDERDMQKCLKFVQPILTNTSLGYAINREQVDDVCRLFQRGMRCVDEFVNECFDQSRRAIFRQSIRGAENVMAKLCYDDAFKSEYIRHAKCYVKLSAKYEQCTDAFKVRMARTSGEAALDARIYLMCSALQSYLECAYARSARQCGIAAAEFLKRYTQEAAGDLVSKACKKYLDSNAEAAAAAIAPPQPQHASTFSSGEAEAATRLLTSLFTTPTAESASERRNTEAPSIIHRLHSPTEGDATTGQRRQYVFPTRAPPRTTTAKTPRRRQKPYNALPKMTKPNSKQQQPNGGDSGITLDILLLSATILYHHFHHLF